MFLYGYKKLSGNTICRLVVDSYFSLKDDEISLGILIGLALYAAKRKSLVVMSDILKNLCSESL